MLGRFGDNNSVYPAPYWYSDTMAYVYDAPEYGKWYRSRDKQGVQMPFSSNLINKKWTLEEEFNNHIMRFQQVTHNSNYFGKLNFYIPGWIVDH